ncbi:MAG TPA: SGNH/GDSL hydrolase family protein [Actinoplanes sp.]|nr:SGNH/GDSL hydrolase family protein [Actinoplanes sp.]
MIRRSTAAVAALSLLAGCAAPVPGRSPVVVTLGDSVPAGTNCGCTPFPDLFAGQLTPPGTSINRAEPGYTTADVQDQISAAGVRADLRRAATVIVMAGANDMAATFDDRDDYAATAQRIGATMTAIINRVRAEHGTAPVDIVVLGYWNVVSDGTVGLSRYGADGLAEARRATAYCNDALRRAADRAGARYLDTSVVFRDDPTALLAPDGDHPDAAGHRAIAGLLSD